jgi:Lysozyme like domain
MNPIPIAAAIIIGLAAILLLDVSGLFTKFSYSELLTLAQNAGFQGQDAATAAAVALAESGGNPKNYNPETAAGAPANMGSYGLWQIYLNVHPEFSGQNLYDPATNAAAAFSVYQAAGNSFSPWTTFKTGAYLAHLPSGTISA